MASLLIPPPPDKYTEREKKNLSEVCLWLVCVTFHASTLTALHRFQEQLEITELIRIKLISTPTTRLPGSVK